MWIQVAFDLPTETKLDKQRASQFRNQLLEDGFTMFQYSVYMRHCASRENAQVHIQRVEMMVPPEGKVSVLTFTDKQFGNMQIFQGSVRQISNAPQVTQLTLF